MKFVVRLYHCGPNVSWCKHEQTIEAADRKSAMTQAYNLRNNIDMRAEITLLTPEEAALYPAH